MHFSRRTFTLSLAGVTAGALVGCRTNPEGPAATDSAQTTATGFPVTIEHARGRTTIESKPQRVVTVGYTDHETVLALGVVPVGVTDWFGERPYGDWPWLAGRWGSELPEIVGEMGTTPNLEKIAALQPDLILGLYAGGDASSLNQQTYDQLSAVAPTVANDPGHDDYTTPWQDMARIAGRALGETAKVEEQIAAIDARFAEVRSRHPERANQRAVVADAGKGAKELYPFSSKDPRGQFLAALGYTADPTLDGTIGDKYGMSLSQENLSLVDIDKLFLLINPDQQGALDSDKVYQALQVVKRGDDIRVPYDTDSKVGAALAFNSLLSIPYGIEAIESYIEK